MHHAAFAEFNDKKNGVSVHIIRDRDRSRSHLLRAVHQDVRDPPPLS